MKTNIIQKKITKHPNEEIMRKVLNLSSRNHGTCTAFIVKDNKIISKDICSYIKTKPGKAYIPTKHAEINAIEKACKKLNTTFLKDCWLYSSLECCPMCTTAALWARIEGIVYCLYEKDLSEKEKRNPNNQWIYIKPKDIIKNAKIKCKVVDGFLRTEGKKILSKYL
jgi:tRNA(Arg) A34 adenosine deaminase TadA